MLEKTIKSYPFILMTHLPSGVLAPVPPPPGPTPIPWCLKEIALAVGPQDRGLWASAFSTTAAMTTYQPAIEGEFFSYLCRAPAVAGTPVEYIRK